MLSGLRLNKDRRNESLRVFRTDSPIIVTTFEDYLPSGRDVERVLSDLPPDIPAKLRWNTKGYDYYAFLPKDNLFDGLFLIPLKYHEPKCVYRDGRWYTDQATSEMWKALDAKFTKSIHALGRHHYVELDHREPDKAVSYGFLRGHKSKQNLLISLKASKHAFVHRLAYLTHQVCLLYKWDTPEIGDQPWRGELVASCGADWVDSVWGAIFTRWKSRNFVGTVARPSDASVKWLGRALDFGVPIWVTFTKPGCYSGQDGDKIILRWFPTSAQLSAARTTQNPGPPPQADTTAAPPPDAITASPPNTTTTSPSDQPTPITRPAVLPERTQWYESWQEFFQKRKQGSDIRLEKASDKDKQSWKSLANNAEKFQRSGKAMVYVWEECPSGGFFREWKTKHDAAREWSTYPREELLFDPQTNSWDHCPFMAKPVVERGPPDDMDEDDDDDEGWYSAPALPAPLPYENPSSLEFLYRRYGFLSIEPTTPPIHTLIPDNATAHRIVGLGAPGDGETSAHLGQFITSILQGQLPTGHCDLSPDSPSNEKFSTLGRSSIQRAVFWSNFPEISERIVYTLADSPETPHLIVVHNPLCVLQLVRVGVSLELTAAVRYLVYNGSRFTLLYPRMQAEITPRFNILAFPIRDKDWKASVQDYTVYLSRLKTFFLERPHMVAAAFSRGGIAWRIAREVLGIECGVDGVLSTYPDQQTPLRMRRRTFWFHEPDEGEWFYLVGGYELLTGW
jgi:hypothetical protein